MKKVTYTLDDDTVEKIRRTAARTNQPQSAVVREAVAQYAPDADRMLPTEIQAKLRLCDAIMAKPPTRPQKDVDLELRQLRESRRIGWQRPERKRG